MHWIFTMLCNKINFINIFRPYINNEFSIHSSCRILDTTYVSLPHSSHKIHCRIASVQFSLSLLWHTFLPHQIGCIYRKVHILYVWPLFVWGFLERLYSSIEWKLISSTNTLNIFTNASSSRWKMIVYEIELTSKIIMG